MSHVDNVEELVKQDRWLQCGKSAYTFKKADLPLCSKKQLAQNFYNVVVVIDLTIFPFLVSPSSLLAANIVLSILSYLRPSHVPNPWYRYRHHLAFSKVGCLVDVANIQVHCTIDNFVAIINEVHCKANVKEAAVVNARHTRIDVCYLCQRLHTSLRPYLIDHLLLV